MASCRIVTPIAAPPEICFDLARDIDFHVRTLEQTREKAVAGRTSGLIEYDEAVTWEAVHFGVRQRLTVKITAFDPPLYFRDEMTAGPFRHFSHDHHFTAGKCGTEMVDEIDFCSPWGILGSAVDALFMKRYLHNLIGRRCHAIRHEAEVRASA